MSEDEAKIIFSKNLNRLMNENSKTQSDIINDLGIKQTTLSDWINAKKYPRIDKIEMLANYFRVQKSDLIEKERPELNMLFRTAEQLTDNELLEIQRYMQFTIDKRKNNNTK